MRAKVLVLSGLAFGLIACTPAASNLDARDTTADPGLPRDANGQSAELLSAFFGLDNSLPMVAHRICLGGSGYDGMPVIFSTEVDHETLQAGDFKVVTQAGVTGEVHCVSLLPAVDPGELRTALLIGEFGDAGEDPPAIVEIVGHVTSLDGTLDFKGASVAVTPLAQGPALVFAEPVDEDAEDLGLGLAGTDGSDCPAGTAQAVRAVWAGGVSLPNGGEIGLNERLLYTVTVEDTSGARREIAPLALADHEDPDNNHLLCLDTFDQAIRVAYPAGIFVDPNDDLNPQTSIEVTR